MTWVEIFTSPLASASFAYVAVVILLAFAVRPWRIEMVQIAESMLKDKKWNASERSEINHLMDTCLSFRVGFSIPVALIWVIIRSILKSPPLVDSKMQRLFDDKRFDMVIIRYFVSILAANPFATLLTLPLTVLLLMVRFVTGSRSVSKALEEPVLHASGKIPELRLA